MRFICFFALIIAPRIAIINGTNSGGGYLWDNNDIDATLNQTPFLLECRAPAHSSLDSINVNLTQRERERVESEGRCFLACATQSQYINLVKQLLNNS